MIIDAIITGRQVKELTFEQSLQQCSL